MTTDILIGLVGSMVIGFITYSLLKKYVFSKLKVNKWVIVGIFVIAFVGPMFLIQAEVIKENSIFTNIQSGVVIVLVLWFMDTMGLRGKPRPAQVNLKTNKTKYATTAVIKAKAKPNRLRNTDMEVIDIKDIKKKKKK
ncbi:MAG: hypothetical protein H7Y18_14760 [Clostridiaceae bacterium]|nr:hypothetical protein [Clostridiaceae bacterium]